MKKRKLFILVGVAAVILVGLVCGVRALLGSGSGETPETYTIVFDRNTTILPWDDETYEYTVDGYDENWQPVTETKTSVITVDYSENAYIAEAIPEPTREGYYFAGWQTRPVVTKDDLINGVSPYQWYFGTQSRFGDASTVMRIADMESLNGSTATLYARWVKMTDIDSEEDLRAIGEDLNGAYRLTADITLTDEWTPIGCYFGNYEYYNTEWWTYAFRGTLDGNGHSITGLTVNGATVDVSQYTTADAASVWHNDGDRADGCAAMFSAIAGADIHNLTLNDTVIDVTGENAAHGDYIYAAPLAAFDMASNIENITVNNPTVKVEIDDTASVLRSSIFTAVSGIEAGGWSNYLTNCTVNGGSITVTGSTVNSHGGEVYAGGIIGECYAFITDCSSSAQINTTVTDNCTAEADAELKVNVGGLDASNTTATGCAVNSEINVNVSKPTGAAQVNVGGFTGAQRYQTAESNTVNAAITTNCTLDPEQGSLNVGSVCGTIDLYYAMQILMYTPVASAGCTGNTVNVSYNGATLGNTVGQLPSLGGQNLAWVNKGEYQIAEGYTVPSNIEAVAEKYGSYIPVDYMQDGIIWIMTE